MKTLTQWLTLTRLTHHQQHHQLTLTRLTHQLKVNRKLHRELIILITVLVGIIAPYIIFYNDNQFSKSIAGLINTYYPNSYTLYYTHLFINFTKSLFVLTVCTCAIMLTDSKRLTYVISTLIMTSMTLDLFSLLSTDFYYFIKPIRYEYELNFKDAYVTIEILCLLISVTRCALVIAKTAFNYYSDRYDALCSTFISNYPR